MSPISEADVSERAQEVVEQAVPLPRPLGPPGLGALLLAGPECVSRSQSCCVTPGVPLIACSGAALDRHGGDPRRGDGSMRDSDQRARGFVGLMVGIFELERPHLSSGKGTSHGDGVVGPSVIKGGFVTIEHALRAIASPQPSPLLVPAQGRTQGQAELYRPIAANVLNELKQVVFALALHETGCRRIGGDGAAQELSGPGILVASHGATMGISEPSQILERIDHSPKGSEARVTSPIVRR